MPNLTRRRLLQGTAALGGAAFATRVVSAAPAAEPVTDALIAAATAVLKREGASLATYGLNSGPQGYRPLRDFLAGKLKGHAGIDCSPDEILITAGSGQGLDLVNNLLLGVTMAALAEGLSLGEALGISRQTMVDTLAAGPVTAPIVPSPLRSW